MISWLEGAVTSVTEERHLKHELRTPVNHIVGYGALLLESASDAGIDSLSQQALRIQIIGKELHVAIEGFLQQTRRIEEVNTLLDTLFALTANVEQGVSEEQSFAVDESFLIDLRRIQRAIHRLQALLKGMVSSC